MVLRRLLLPLLIASTAAFWSVDRLPAADSQAPAADLKDGVPSAKTAVPKPEPPPPRTRREVEAVLGIKNQSPQPVGEETQKQRSLRPLKIVLLAGKKDHGPGEHDYPAWQTKWQPMLARLPAVTVDIAYGWPSEQQWRDANLVVAYYWNHEWSDEQFRQLDDFLVRGGGLVHLHAASIHDHDAEPLARRLGLAFQQPIMKWRHGPVHLKIEAQAEEPITHGLPRTIDFTDESYWLATGDKSKVQILATTDEEDKSWPMLWTFEPNKNEGGKGRVVCCVMGHYMWTFDDPLFRLLLLRSAAWAAGEPAGRFQELATYNVRLIDDGKP